MVSDQYEEIMEESDESPPYLPAKPTAPHPNEEHVVEKPVWENTRFQAVPGLLALKFHQEKTKKCDKNGLSKTCPNR